MSELKVSAPLRSWMKHASNHGWTGTLFWSVLLAVTVLLFVSGYSAIVGADKAN